MDMADQPRIRDVAALAGTSVSTVSNLLNGRPDRMRPETVRRIEEAIEQLGYRPSWAARQLKTGFVPVIGLLVPSVANPFHGAPARDRLEGYRQALADAGLAADPKLIAAGDAAVGYDDTHAAEHGRAAAASLLRLARPPTALVALNDMHAVGACAAVRDAGGTVPDD